MKKLRQIIQIAESTDSSGNTITALCDDGTIWKTRSWNIPHGSKWVEVNTSIVELGKGLNVEELLEEESI
jgi:hypothetical protein